MTKSRDIADSINRIDSSAANATAMTIDASENVLVGTTNTVPGVSNSDTGIAMSQANGIIISRSSEAPINANRASDDGDIILLRQGGERVGSIQSVSGVVSQIIFDPRNPTYEGAGLGGGSFDATSALIVPRTELVITQMVL
jgi:hypothetical protein